MSAISDWFNANGIFFSCLYILLGLIAIYIVGKVLTVFVQAIDVCLLFCKGWAVDPSVRLVSYAYEALPKQPKLNFEDIERVPLSFPRNSKDGEYV
ncbi:envelope protein [Bottlenose dolphin coronavirus HKU22]|uniref:Envelope protein n=1 Tax=Bottlenose dolphin coronavirus HKU22 TaxID=1433215 RepID=V5TGY8_BWCOV|nr:envelope protein [Bottlenose dolphin coronavirus HKU22]AHB63496.1 envelope protein [Bottlenose dolphin coronavirus HKU22]AHB63509.1 envelope protein [Bottlenose dolphin coronavirus HKU22]